MNKGILVHMAATVFYILAVFFIIGDGETDTFGRAVIVTGFVFTQVAAAMFSDFNDLYDKK